MVAAAAEMEGVAEETLRERREVWRNKVEETRKIGGIRMQVAHGMRAWLERERRGALESERRRDSRVWGGRARVVTTRGGIPDAAIKVEACEPRPVNTMVHLGSQTQGPASGMGELGEMVKQRAERRDDVRGLKRWRDQWGRDDLIRY